MADLNTRRPADWQQRAQAVDISLSCIVQAPAGSGKTELLVQRILALLAAADSPEEILAITFTRKAAGEMRVRLLQALESAQSAQPPTASHARETWERARRALARDRERDWNLLRNPARLQLTTIDSFCAFVTRRMPWVARFGESPGVTDDPQELYRLAAAALLSRVESGGAGQGAIERLLIHLDNRMTLLRDLLVAMLGRRDQWLRHLMAQRIEVPRQVLEDGLQLYVNAYLRHLCDSLGVELCQELCRLARFAGDNLVTQSDDNPFAEVHDEATTFSRPHWLALAHLVLTAGGDVRKSVSRTLGFPADKTPDARAMKARVLEVLDRFHDTPALAEALRGVRKLPSSEYDANQWSILEALIELLPLAVLELQEVFRFKGQVDFIEVAGAARSALGTEMNPEELLLQLDSRIRHILVDEFQDTSYAQYDLLKSLTAGWIPGDGRTLFVVGDPMQSIYRFREAEVGLYLRVCQQGLASLPMARIVLNTNFRSCKSLVDWANRTFDELFPAVGDEVRGAVPFSRAAAFDLEDSASTPVTVHGFVGRQDEEEANIVVDLIRKAQAKDALTRTAVLVRSRSHLQTIVAALKHAGIPFQAQEIEPLMNRPVVQDIVALARAIHSPADRVAWLSVLRAPWCGLTLGDLTVLCGRDSQATIWQLLTQPREQVEMFEQVSDEGRARLERILPVLARVLNNRGRLPLRRLIESAWLGLGGPACVGEADLKDAAQVFSLLDGLALDDHLDLVHEQIEKLYAAPDPQAGPEVQLMTIHKAKGLEFDTVILPGLGRGVRGSERALLRWLEHPDYELLLAPVPPLLSDQQEATYQAIGNILKEKDDHETVRLLYVAATRAKTQLHLLGHVNPRSSGTLAPTAGSLLAVLWPSCADSFLKEPILPAGDETLVAPPVALKRLPLNWVCPELPVDLKGDVRETRRASIAGAVFAQENTIRSLRSEEGRFIGTIVHQWLERIAKEGLAGWLDRPLEGYHDHIRQQLCLAGVPSGRLEACGATVLACLDNTLRSERGRWLLTAHAEAASEFALNGVVQGQLVRATIDRTFVDAEGIRWVVDYKTAAPADNKDQAAFLDRETERYKEQLASYAALLRQLPGQGEVRAALYFPLFDGWREIVDTGKEKPAPTP